jgi:hypothetical protein
MMTEVAKRVSPAKMKKGIAQQRMRFKYLT